MSVLKIQYGDLTLFDGEVEGLRWDDVPGSCVTVTAQIAKPKQAGTALTAIADMISQASKAKTDQKRHELVEATDG